jgi:hypothetical protein
MASSGRFELPSHWERRWDVAFVSAETASETDLPALVAALPYNRLSTAGDLRTPSSTPTLQFFLKLKRTEPHPMALTPSRRTGARSLMVLALSCFP